MISDSADILYSAVELLTDSSIQNDAQNRVCKYPRLTRAQQTCWLIAILKRLDPFRVRFCSRFLLSQLNSRQNENLAILEDVANDEERLAGIWALRHDRFEQAVAHLAELVLLLRHPLNPSSESDEQSARAKRWFVDTCISSLECSTARSFIGFSACVTLASHLLLHPALSTSERSSLSSRFAQYNEQYAARTSSCSQSPASTPTVRSASVSPVKCGANSDVCEHQNAAAHESLEAPQLTPVHAGETDRVSCGAVPSCASENELCAPEPPALLAPNCPPEDAEAEAEGSVGRTSREMSLFSSCTASTNASVVLDFGEPAECACATEQPESCATPIGAGDSQASVAVAEPALPDSSTAASTSRTRSLEATRANASLECSRAAPLPIASRRLSAWLRQLRLHKYEALLSTLSFNELLALSDEWLAARGVTQGASRKILCEVQRLGEQVAALRRLEMLVLKGRLDAVPVALQTLSAALAIPFMSAPAPSAPAAAVAAAAAAAAPSQAPYTRSQTRDDCSAFGAGTSSNNGHSNNGQSAAAEADAPKELLRHLFTDSVSDTDVATHFVRAMAKVYDMLSVERKESKHIVHFCLLVARTAEHEGFTGEHRALLRMWREKLEPLLPPGVSIPLLRQSSSGAPAFGARGGFPPPPHGPTRFLPPPLPPPPPMQHRAMLAFAWPPMRTPLPPPLVMQSFPGAQWPPPLPIPPAGFLPPFMPPPGTLPPAPPFLLPPGHPLMPSQCTPFPAPMTAFHPSAAAAATAEPVLCPNPNRSLPTMAPRWSARPLPVGSAESSLLNSNAPEFTPSASAAFADVNLSGCSTRSEPAECNGGGGGPSAESEASPARFSGPFSLRNTPLQRESCAPAADLPAAASAALMRYLFAGTAAPGTLESLACTAPITAQSFSLSQQQSSNCAAAAARSTCDERQVAPPLHQMPAEQRSTPGDVADGSDAPLDLDSLCLSVTRAGLDDGN